MCVYIYSFKYLKYFRNNTILQHLVTEIFFFLKKKTEIRIRNSVKTNNKNTRCLIHSAVIWEPAKCFLHYFLFTMNDLGKQQLRSPQMLRT